MRRSHTCLQYGFPVPYDLRVKKIIREDRWRAIDIIKPRNSKIVPIVHYTIERMENPRLIHGILFEYQKSIIQIFNISYPLK